jgi:acyl carrier protein
LLKIIETLKKYVIDELAPEYDINDLDVEQSLIETGILDSMGIVKIVAFIEEEYQIKVEDEDLLPENFEKICSIAELISRKT